MIPVSSLGNLEYMLYPDSIGTTSASVPSVTNHYTAAPTYPSIWNNTMPVGYNARGPAFKGNATGGYYQTDGANFGQATTPATGGVGFEGLTPEETKKVLNYYAKSLEPIETLGSAATMGAAFSLVMYPRMLVHPLNNTIWSIPEANRLFKDVTRTGTKLNKLWLDPKKSAILQDAYSQVQKAAARRNWKIGAFRARYTPAQYKQMITQMEKAIEIAKRTGNVAEVARVTEMMKHAYVTDGWIPKAWHTVKGWFGGTSSVAKVSDRMADTATIAANAKNSLDLANNMTFKKAIMHGGKMGAILNVGFEFAFGLGNIITAFKQDKEDKAKGLQSQNYGWKQLGQTTGKSILNAAGWAVGEGAGIWASAKLGAKLGAKVHPLLGTIAGGILGMVGGSIGIWGSRKLGKAVFGDNIANKLTAQNQMKVEGGREEILMAAYQNAQKDKDIDSGTAQALDKAISVYA